MRRMFLVAALLLMAPVQGQTSEPWLIDDAGDVEYLVAESEGAPATPVESHGRADLLRLDIQETLTAMHFIVEVADMSDFPEGSGRWADAARIDIRFMLGDIYYDVSTGTFDDGVPFIELRGGGTDQSDPVITTDLPVTLEGNVFTVEVDREWLRDHNGAPVQTGMQLRDLRVDTHAHATGVFLLNPDGSLFQPLGIRDRMPDEGFATYDVQMGGPVSEGEMNLQVPAPFRASNGGEATIAFSYLLTNTATADARFNIDIEGAPPAWALEFVGSTVVEAGETVQGNIVVHTPFGHQHGGSETIALRVQRADDAATHGTATLGIVYLEIPQPAGHHNTLYLHAQSPANLPGGTEVVQMLGGKVGNVWMNTLQEDANADGSPHRGLAATNFPFATAERYEWFICLKPNLQLGLDFNGETGTATIPLSAGRSATGTLHAELIHLSPGKRLAQCLPSEWSDRTQTVVASTPTSEPTDIDGGTTFTLDVAATPAGDFVPYERGTDLVWHMVFEMANPANLPLGPELLPGGNVQLPLDEYFDEHPAGIVHDEEEDHGHEMIDAHDDDAAPKSTPGPALAATLAALLAIRRRHP